MSKELRTLQQELQAVRCERDKLQQKVEAMCKSRGERMFSSSYLLSERVQLLQSELQQLQTELSCTKSERDNLREDIMQLRSAKRLSDIGWRDEKLRSRDLERKLSSAAAEEQEEHAFDASLLRRRVKRLEASLQEARVQAVAEQQQRHDLDVQLATAKQQLACTEVELQRERAAVERMQHDSENMAEKEAGPDMQEALTAQLAAAHAELEMVRSQAAAAQQDMQQLTLDHDKACKEAHEELVSTRKQLSRVNNELNAKRNRLNDLEMLVEQTSAALLVSQSAVMQLQHDKASGMELVRQESAQIIKNLEAEVKKLQGQLAEEEALLTQSAKDKLILMEELSAAEQKVDVLQAHANDLKIRLAQATEEKVAALLQLATLSDHMDGMHLNGAHPKQQHEQQPGSPHAHQPWPSPLSRTGSSSSSSSSPLPSKLQRLPTTLWQKLLEGQAAFRQQLAGFSYMSSPREPGGWVGQHQGTRYHHHLLQPQHVMQHEQCQEEEKEDEGKRASAPWVLGEDGGNREHQHQQGDAQVGVGGSRQQQGEEAGAERDGVDLLQRLQRAAELIQEYKVALKGVSKSVGGVSPRGSSSTSSSKAVGGGVQGSALGVRPGVQQLHEELQQRWKRMGLTSEGTDGLAPLGRCISEAAAHRQVSPSPEGTEDRSSSSSRSGGGHAPPLRRSISNPARASSSTDSEKKRSSDSGQVTGGDCGASGFLGAVAEGDRAAAPDETGAEGPVSSRTIGGPSTSLTCHTRGGWSTDSSTCQIKAAGGTAATTTDTAAVPATVATPFTSPSSIVNGGTNSEATCAGANPSRRGSDSSAGSSGSMRDDSSGVGVDALDCPSTPGKHAAGVPALKGTGAGEKVGTGSSGGGDGGSGGCSVPQMQNGYVHPAGQSASAARGVWLLDQSSSSSSTGLTGEGKGVFQGAEKLPASTAAVGMGAVRLERGGNSSGSSSKAVVRQLSVDRQALVEAVSMMEDTLRVLQDALSPAQ